MIKQNSNHIGSLVELRAAMKTAEGVQIEEILDRAENVDSLSEAVRYAMCNYVKEIPGVTHTENCLIWAIPVLFQNGVSHFHAQDGSMKDVVDASSQLLLRKYFGAEYSVIALTGIVPLNVLGSMPVAEHIQLFGRLAGDADRDGQQPMMTVDDTIVNQLKDGQEPEIAFLVGSMSRVNRMPVIRGRSKADADALGRELAGRIGLHASKFPEHGELIVGTPADLQTAYEAGIKSLIDYLTFAYATAKPSISCTGSNDFILRFNVVNRNSHLITREIKLKRTIAGMDGIKRIFDYASEKCGDLPPMLAAYGHTKEVMH